jgi:hypothetical protein
VLSGGSPADWFDVDGGTDLDVRGISWADVDTVVSGFDSASRPRWNGVIGGGPFGGVDLSVVSGKCEYDVAVADGTSAANTGAWARWDEQNSRWYYVDPTGTIP